MILEYPKQTINSFVNEELLPNIVGVMDISFCEVKAIKNC
jgi:hypothetical protein